MLFITPTTSARGAKDYFSRQLAPSDYYVRDAAEEAGQWHGLGAELLGLKGDVRKEDFFALCDNRNPVTGEALTARTKGTRRVCTDFTFDAPKAVTLALEIGGDNRVLDAFGSAVSDTMAEMEADMHTRVRTRGAQEDRRTSNMVWAEFVHRTTRPVDGVPDPQLHCHAVVFNATFDPEEERWKAGQFGPLVRDKLYYQSAFHARLAERLQALGYGVRREGTSFTLDGIDRATVLTFSRRLAQIDAEASRLGISDPKARGELGKRTRGAKAGGASLAELQAEWRSRLTADQLSRFEDVRGEEKTANAQEAIAAVTHAVAHSFERSSVVPEKRLVAEALMHGVGRVRVRDVWEAERRSHVVRREAAGEVLATTRDVYREEAVMLAFARRGRGTCQRLGGSPQLDAGLTEEQRAAALHVLASRDRVIGLRGGAGTGKTRMMQATVRAIEASGLKVHCFAPSAKASRGVLREEGFDDADTVERLLTDRDLRQQVRGQVLWIDEAGLLGSRDMRRLFDLARQEGCRVVLSGDSAQHASVGRGDALRLLESDAGLPFAELKSIRRQTAAEYREAVREIAQGDARGPNGRTYLEAGIARLDRMGAIVEVGGAERFSRIARDYAEATRAGPGIARTALVVSPTHREGEKVAQRIREELRSEGRLGSEERSFVSLRPIGLTQAGRTSGDSYRGGEIIRFHQNAKGFRRGERVTVIAAERHQLTVERSDGSRAKLALSEAGKFEVYEARSLALAVGDRLRITLNGSSAAGSKSTAHRLNNGDAFDVAGFTQGGDIRLANGWVLSKDYGGIAQGYVVTSHAAQGSTVDRVLIALGSESLAAANRQQFYVSVSRGREAVRLYTDDKGAMAEAIKDDATRLSATELLGSGRARPGRDTATGGRLMALQRLRSARQQWLERTRGPWWAGRGSQEGLHGRH